MLQLPIGGLGVVLVGLWVSGCATGAIRDEMGIWTQQWGPRGAIIAQVDAAGRAAKAGDWSRAGQRLEAAWTQRDALEDDRLIRVGIASLPETDVPPSLQGAWTLERARKTLGVGDDAGAKALAAPLLTRKGGPNVQPVTRARAHFIAALARMRHRPADALGHLRAAARIVGSGADIMALRGRAWLTLAGLEHDAGHTKEAIAAYLKVERRSGVFRAARLGLAWLQLRRDRPLRTFRILALLPGGSAGDPERAILASIAAEALGRPDDARTIIAIALENTAAWDPSQATDAQIIDAVRVRAPSGPLEKSPENIWAIIADSAAVRGVALELIASETLDRNTPGLANWRTRLSAALAVAIESARGDQRRRIQGAIAALRAQQVAPTGP